MKVDYDSNVHTACSTGGDSEYNIEVSRGNHQAITEFEKGAHVKEDAASLKRMGLRAKNREG